MYGLNVGWRDRPQHRIDVLAQDAGHDFRMFVARLDVLREPDFTEPLHGGHFELQRLLGLLGCSDVDAALDLRSVLTHLLARILERELRVAPEHLLLRAPVQSVAEDPRSLSGLRCDGAGDEGQAFAHAAVYGAGSEPGLDLAVSDRSLLSAHVPKAPVRLWGF